MTKLDTQILKSQQKIKLLREQRRKEKQAREKKARPAKKRGRPPVPESKLIAAIKLAETKPLYVVASKLNISISTLTRRNIKRCVLNGETV
jgi:hypothetical protein